MYVPPPGSQRLEHAELWRARHVWNTPAPRSGSRLSTQICLPICHPSYGWWVSLLAAPGRCPAGKQEMPGLSRGKWHSEEGKKNPLSPRRREKQCTRRRSENLMPDFMILYTKFFYRNYTILHRTTRNENLTRWLTVSIFIKPHQKPRGDIEARVRHEATFRPCLLVPSLTFAFHARSIFLQERKPSLSPLTDRHIPLLLATSWDTRVWSKCTSEQSKKVSKVTKETHSASPSASQKSWDWLCVSHPSKHFNIITWR